RRRILSDPGSRISLCRRHRQPSDQDGILPAVHPVVLEWGPLVIRWYGVMMAITVLTGVAMALRVGPRLGIPAQEIDRLTLPFVLLAFVGARLGYVVSHPAEFTSPLQIYEMVFATAILALTLPLVRRRQFPGQIFWTVVILTSVGRIVLDLLRSEDRVFGVMTLGQIPAAILIVIGAWFLARHSPRAKRLDA